MTDFTCAQYDTSSVSSPPSSQSSGTNLFARARSVFQPSNVSGGGSAPTPTTDRPFYVVYVELDNRTKQSDVFLSASELLVLDESLRRVSTLYDEARVSNSLAPCQVHCVRSGTFDRLRREMATRSAGTVGVELAKIPRVLHSPELLLLLHNASYTDARK